MKRPYIEMHIIDDKCLTVLASQRRIPYDMMAPLGRSGSDHVIRTLASVSFTSVITESSVMSSAPSEQQQQLINTISITWRRLHIIKNKVSIIQQGRNDNYRIKLYLSNPILWFDIFSSSAKNKCMNTLAMKLLYDKASTTINWIKWRLNSSRKSVRLTGLSLAREQLTQLTWSYY